MSVRAFINRGLLCRDEISLDARLFPANEYLVVYDSASRIFCLYRRMGFFGPN